GHSVVRNRIDAHRQQLGADVRPAVLLLAAAYGACLHQNVARTDRAERFRRRRPVDLPLNTAGDRHRTPGFAYDPRLGLVLGERGRDGGVAAVQTVGRGDRQIEVRAGAVAGIAVLYPEIVAGLQEDLVDLRRFVRRRAGVARLDGDLAAIRIEEIAC